MHADALPFSRGRFAVVAAWVNAPRMQLIGGNLGKDYVSPSEM
jgi:hypothetical protein